MIITNWKLDLLSEFDVNYQFNFEYFTGKTNDVFWITDTIDTYLLGELLRNSPSVPKYIIGDNSANICYPTKIFTTVFRGLELEFLGIRSYLTDNPDSESIDSLSTLQCFNFLINKKQINRFLLIKLVEYFKLSSFKYTWSGIGRDFDLQELLDECDRSRSDNQLSNLSIRSKILAAISLPKNFVNLTNNSFNDNASIVGYGHNAKTWTDIFSHFMPETAVALISESVQFQRSAVFTEKTLYSILAMNFPIFIGGYGHADQFEKLGFDNFSDLLDHSYQYKETLFDRCYYAFLNNLRLLTDLEYVKRIRQDNFFRLLNNKKLLFNGQISKAVSAEVSNWPEDLQNLINPIYSKLRYHYSKRSDY